MDEPDALMTPVSVPGYNPRIRYRDTIFMIGSCFTEHINRKLERYKYGICSNPFGILYNPVSMAIALERIVQHRFYDAEELVYHQGLYHSMDHHGSFSGKNAEDVAAKINSSMRQAHDLLKKSTHVFISPGTSKVYTYHPSGQVVGNCHKIPQTAFDYSQLSMDTCIEAFERIYNAVTTISPQTAIIWTISPVRHVRDGLIENQRSKALLIMATDHMLKNHPGSNYFPAYEIMMDQLRDYRFYARDLIHPSEVAIDIIWEIFCDAYLDPHERIHHDAIEKIKRAMEHRWLHQDPEAIRAFAKNQLRQIDEMASVLPDDNWQQERQYFFQLTEQD